MVMWQEIPAIRQARIPPPAINALEILLAPTGKETNANPNSNGQIQDT